MRKFSAVVLVLLMFFTNLSPALAIQEVAQSKGKPIVYKQNAQTIKYAFIFDGPSDKNDVVLKQFQAAITKSTAPDFKAEFPSRLIYVGNWTRESVHNLSEKASRSDATVIVSLGYLSTMHFNNTKNVNKFVITIDQYGLRDMGEGFFNPITQSIKGVNAFKKSVNFKKTAILVNENYYKIRNDWQTFLAPKLQDIDFKMLPVTQDVDRTIASIPSDCYAVVLTPLFNLSKEKRQDLINKLNEKRLPTYSTLGKEDVEMGVMLGSGAYDLDRKLAEASSFNIKGLLYGEIKKSEKMQFYEDEIYYLNEDTCDAIGYKPHLRVVHVAEVISNKTRPSFDLTAVFDNLDEHNIDIARKRLLVKAARRSAVSAALKYLPTFGINLGYQSYNYDYAESAKSSLPQKTGILQLGFDQMIYSPALVANILIKKKGLDFSKADLRMQEQNMGIEVALLYIDALMLQKIIEVQKEYVKESREALAISRVREKSGYCGKEEALRWAADLNLHEQKLIDLRFEYDNVKLNIAKMLHMDQTVKYDLGDLTAMDPAFYIRDIHIIDYVLSPQNLEEFTKMLIGEAYRVAPELEKLKAAMKMKDYEQSMYVQRFILPDAKLSYTYTSLMDREFTSRALLPTPIGLVQLGPPNATNGLFGVFASWKPIEGGTKIAEIMRIKAEKDELIKHDEEVRAELEQAIRSTVNRAVAAYFSIGQNYKAMSASEESYRNVKEMYLRDKAPISQVVDAQQTYLNSKLAAMNSQYSFFKELVWVQRAICSVNWNKATPESKNFIQSIKDKLEKRVDITL